MDIFQRFKNFLGLTPNTYNSEQPDRLPPPSWKGDNSIRSQPPTTIVPDHHDVFGFNIFSSPLEMHRYFEHHMTEMLKNFGIFADEESFFGHFGRNADPFSGHNETFQFPSIDDFSKENQLRSGSLRDQYLKSGYEAVPHGQQKIDKDVDEKFNMNELDRVFKGDSVQVQPKKFFFGQSVTSKTIRNVDGTVESHKTIRDEEGNEETIVTKRHGDKEYSVTTKTNKDGVQEVIENMVNLDENEKENFLKKNKRLDPDVKPPLNDFPYNTFF